MRHSKLQGLLPKMRKSALRRPLWQAQGRAHAGSHRPWAEAAAYVRRVCKKSPGRGRPWRSLVNLAKSVLQAEEQTINQAREQAREQAHAHTLTHR